MIALTHNEIFPMFDASRVRNEHFLAEPKVAQLTMIAAFSHGVLSLVFCDIIQTNKSFQTLIQNALNPKLGTLANNTLLFHLGQSFGRCRWKENEWLIRSKTETNKSWTKSKPEK